jgi:phosphinothricin acetyltransferase
VALHEGVGFSPVGVYSRVGHKLGAWHDVGWWQRPLTRHEASPPEPRDLASVEQAPGFEELLARGVSVVRPEPERV